jgi:tetratricopeptide (TPR) repeat protein
MPDRPLRLLATSLGPFAGLPVPDDVDLVLVDAETCERIWNDPTADWWRDVVPAGWEPDVALIWSPEYLLVPPRLPDLPCPTVAWIGDWYLNTHVIGQLAAQVDLVLADAVGSRILRDRGIAHVEEISPWGFDAAVHKPDWDAEPLWDLGFVGNFNDAIQRERNRWLARVAQLSDRWRVCAVAGLYGEDFARFMQRSRITFNRSVSGALNMRCFEATACGSLVLVERSNLEIANWFEPGREVVLYGDDDFEEVVEHYLVHEDERRAIAEAGWRRVQEHAPAPRLARLLDRLREVAAGGITRPVRASTPAHGAQAAFQALMSNTSPPPIAGCELLLDQAENADPDPATLVNRGVLYMNYAHLGTPQEAVEPIAWATEYHQRALEADPSDAVARLNSIRMAEVVGARAAAAAVARDLVEAIERGEAVARPDRMLYPGRLSAFTMSWYAAINAGDDAALTRLVLAQTLQSLGDNTEDPAERADIYARALEAHPEDIDVHHKRAQALLAMGRPREATHATAALLAERPLDIDVWSTHVTALMQAGAQEAAQAFVAGCEPFNRSMPPRATVVAQLNAPTDGPAAVAA